MRRTTKRPRWLAILATAVLATPAGSVVSTPAAHAAGTRPFSLTITHVSCVDDCSSEGLEGPLDGHADFYAKVWINGVKQPPGSDPDDPSTPVIDNNGSIDPTNWVLSAQVPDDIQNVPVAIQIWDEDTFDDDIGDASPRDGDNTLDFRVSYFDGKWIDHTGNEDRVNWPQSCSTGDGDDNDEPRVKVCFDVSTQSTSGDLDGDGLLDGWERNGYSEGGSNIDVPLPSMGAKVDHKDIFLELDSQAGQAPSHAGIQAMKKAFAAAPPNAGWTAGSRQAQNGGPGVSAPPNGDGPGITLHVDTGGLRHPTGREGAPNGDCADGVDNDSDALPDGLDPNCIGPLVDYRDASNEDPAPGSANCTNGIDDDGDQLADDRDSDCLVGDNLGGGDVLATSPNACGLDANFYSTKRSRFNQNRRKIFHYAVMAMQPGTCPAPSGGQGERGGNDFAVFSPDAGTIMHELGHNLNLDHGGFETANCKPNYVSVMDYDEQFGVSRVDGGTVLDFSPPRVTFDGTTRGVAPLPTLVEDTLTEPTILDASDPANQFVFVNSAGQKIPNPLNTSPDWNGNAGPVPPVNIDTVDPAGNPADCVNGSTNSTLVGADDWSFVSLPFRQFGDSATAGVNLETEPVPTEEDLLAMATELNTTDVAVTVSDSPDPVAAGTDLGYTVTVTNHGPRPATSVVLTDTLPAEVSLRSADPACRGTGTLTCAIGHLAAGASRTLSITVHVPADLVSHGGPATIVNRASVDNVAGPDPSPANDSASQATTVLAVADLAVTAASLQTPPTQVVIGQTATITLHDTVTNSGPSSPMDATVVTVATADAGATVTPASSTRAVDALAIGAPRSTTTTFTVACQRPGSHTYRFTDTVAPAHAADVDPDLANNQRQVAFTLDCVVPVAINIRPGVNPNWVNIPLDVVPAAVLTTNAGEYGLPLAFDATTIQPQTVHFGPRRLVYPNTGGSPAVQERGVVVTVPERGTGPVEPVIDLDPDMLMLFNAWTSGLDRTDTEACIKGSYTDRATGQTYRFLGCDTVRILQP